MGWRGPNAFRTVFHFSTPPHAIDHGLTEYPVAAERGRSARALHSNQWRAAKALVRRFPMHSSRLNFWRVGRENGSCSPGRVRATRHVPGRLFLLDATPCNRPRAHRISGCRRTRTLRSRAALESAANCQSVGSTFSHAQLALTHFPASSRKRVLFAWWGGGVRTRSGPSSTSRRHPMQSTAGSPNIRLPPNEDAPFARCTQIGGEVKTPGAPPHDFRAPLCRVCASATWRPIRETTAAPDGPPHGPLGRAAAGGSLL